MNNTKLTSKNITMSFEANKQYDDFLFATSIKSALKDAEKEQNYLDFKIVENFETIKQLTPECDKIDYSLAACSGVLCGLIDVFLVGTPDDSSLSNLSDKWFEDRTKGFAKLYGWKENDTKNPLEYLEKIFPVPYDQTGMGESGLQFLNLTPSNHHFKSIAHNPSLLGLFFSILDQFGDVEHNTSHFVSAGDLVIWSVPGEKLELRGKNLPSKLFSGFVNWFGHLVSDMSGSSSSKGRGMGIPSPLWTWTNDIIAIKRRLNIAPSEFDQSINELALNIYTKGYDIRFQALQAIPVFINEMIVRVFYSLRRTINYFQTNNTESFDFNSLWDTCEPFSNATIKRMLTVAHGTFCLIDLGDATIQGVVKGGGTFNVKEFFLRLNLPGVGRFTISLYGEVNRKYEKVVTEEETEYLQKRKAILDDYVIGLQTLSEVYNNDLLMTFANDLYNSDLYLQAFSKSIQIAEKRNVPDNKILKTKEDIDTYFGGGNN